MDILERIDKIVNEGISDWDFKEMGGGAIKGSKNFKHVLNIIGHGGKYMLSMVSDTEHKMYDKKRFSTLEDAKKFCYKKL